MLNQLHLAMLGLYKGDAKRIQHFCKVHSYAKLIAECEKVDKETLFVLEAAALTHDIGIHLCEEKYGDCENADRRRLYVGRRADYGGRRRRQPAQYERRYGGPYDGRRAVRDVRDRIGLLFRETGRADGCRRRPQRDPGDYAGAVCAASCGRDRGGRYAAETRECVRRD